MPEPDLQVLIVDDAQRGRRFVLVGTAHVWSDAAAIGALIADRQPQAVVVELDLARVNALVPDLAASDTRVVVAFPQQRPATTLAAILFAVRLAAAGALQPFLGELAGTPGSDQQSAIEAARTHGALIVLGDRNILATLARAADEVGLLASIRQSPPDLSYMSGFLNTPHSLSSIACYWSSLLAGDWARMTAALRGMERDASQCATAWAKEEQARCVATAPVGASVGEGGSDEGDEWWDARGFPAEIAEWQQQSTALNSTVLTAIATGSISAADLSAYREAAAALIRWYRSAPGRTVRLAAACGLPRAITSERDEVLAAAVFASLGAGGEAEEKEAAAHAVEGEGEEEGEGEGEGEGCPMPPLPLPPPRTAVAVLGAAHLPGVARALRGMLAAGSSLADAVGAVQPLLAPQPYYAARHNWLPAAGAACGALAAWRYRRRAPRAAALAAGCTLTVISVAALACVRVAQLRARVVGAFAAAAAEVDGGASGPPLRRRRWW